MNYRRLARIAYIGLFVAVSYGTELFTQFPLLWWAAVAGLVVVFFDAVICARRRLRVLRAEMNDSDDEPDPAC